MVTFKEKWLEAVDRKNSVLCAGLDPAESEMGRGKKGLPEDVHKLDWALQYVEAIAPFCAALKPNINYWKSRVEHSGYGGDMACLYELALMAQDLGMVVVDDSKVADIGESNDAGMFYAAQKSFDAITYSPFTGNMEEAAKQARVRGLGLISMVLMSNPDYAREKLKLVPISSDEVREYREDDILKVGGPHVSQYKQLAHDAAKFGLDGVVIGAPSEKNHITEDEIGGVRHYVGDEMLVLLPGIGAQGGDAAVIWRYFAASNVIVNVGRELMFPNGSHSTPREQAEKAGELQTLLNRLRGQ